jgi:PAS domain-containing protein
MQPAPAPSGHVEQAMHHNSHNSDFIGMPPEQDGESTAVGLNLQAAFNLNLRNNLRLVTAGFTLLYFAVASFHAFSGLSEITLPLLGTATTTSLLLFGTWHWLGRHRLPPQYAHATTSVILGLVFSNILLHLYLVVEPRDMIFPALFVVGIGCLFLSLPWLAGMLAVANISTLCLSWSSHHGRNWLDLVYMQAAATVVSVIVCCLRMRALQRLEVVRVHDKRHKLELENALQSIRPNEERFRLLSESVLIGIFQADQTGECAYTNMRWQTITGLSLEESLTCQWDDVLHEADRRTAREK